MLGESGLLQSSMARIYPHFHYDSFSNSQDKDLPPNIERYLRLIHPHDYTQLQKKGEGDDNGEEGDNEDKVEEVGKEESEDSILDDTDGSHDGLDDKKKPAKKRDD
ncbi:expressed unknown protein [Seminavis robusta]|uniref:Uncharacterized protein n=1 Tax=Seminavis robusta TaxID=568900 RepID=A0A9N8HTQ1_9STRA|nr:expressed unknown protein [Seminavis robusta]|eukprot:Sro1919_g305480.1 n/a (106) ;mRNA; r:15074-15391